MAWKVRIHDRGMEWLFASYTLVFGATLSAPADSINPVTLRLLLQFLPEPVWAFGFTVAGTLHCAALAINGRAWWTPFARATAAGLNFLAYVMLAVSIWYATPWSTGVPTYIYLVCGGLGMIWFRAMRECFLLRRAWDAAS